MITRILKGSAIALLALMMLAPMASAQRGRVIFRGGVGFGGYWGPGWYGYPYWQPYGYYVGPPTGEVKLTAPAKDDQVFVDGAYAGQAGKLKHFNLSAGTHSIAVRDISGENTVFETRIDVIAGKTIHVGG
jgi:hypothetical protein